MGKMSAKLCLVSSDFFYQFFNLQIWSVNFLHVSLHFLKKVSNQFFVNVLNFWSWHSAVMKLNPLTWTYYYFKTPNALSYQTWCLGGFTFLPEIRHGGSLKPDVHKMSLFEKNKSTKHKESSFDSKSDFTNIIIFILKPACLICGKCLFSEKKFFFHMICMTMGHKKFI